MLFTSVGTQHAARCYQPNSFRLGRNRVWLQHRRCAMVQPRSHRPIQVLAAAKQASTSAAGASSKSSSNTNSSNRLFFHNRGKELKLLAELCSAQPLAITVILGPLSTGKTALLLEYMHDRGLADSSCFIDARVTPISTPSDLAQVLLESAVPELVRGIFPGVRGLRNIATQLATALSGEQDKLQLPDGNEIMVNANVIEPIVKALAGNSEQAPALATVTAAYVALLDAWYQARADGQLNDVSPPVLVLDEANVLMSWGAQYQAERQELLRFFVAITKVQRRSHVLLATSDYAFQNWLTKGIGPGFHDTFVIGDLPAKEAREFLDKCLQQDGDPEVSNTDWKDVHKACGGNAGALLRAARFYHMFGGWEAALTQVTKDMFLSMEPGYAPAADAGYTATDYATAVKAILESPYNAVDKQQLMAELGKQALDAMVQANLLALRPYSFWATDIHVEAFGPKQRFTVVTAPTTLHLYLMEQECDMLLKPLEVKQVPAQANTDSSAPPSRSGRPTSDTLRAVGADIKAVQDKIEDVERQMQEVSSEISDIRRAKGDGWWDELAYWRKKEQQLAEKERQLRENKRQLQDEELLTLLLKRDE